MKKYNKNAFTLAEVLVTMIIVGVISALTVPSLKNHSEEVKYIASTQKAMSEVAAVVGQLELVHGDSSTWNFDSSTTKNWFKKGLNTAPFPNGVSSWERLTLSGTEAKFRPLLMTTDGMAWEIHKGGYACGGGVALIDVNGPKPPNTIGIDMQGFRIGHHCGGDDDKKKLGDSGVFAMGDGVNDVNKEWACTSYIIKNKKMPWLYKSASSCSEFAGK